MTRSMAIAIAVWLCPGLILGGCNKKPSSAPQGRSAEPGARTEPAGAAIRLLTKEEVGAVLGQPVTSVDGTDSHPTYKTAVVLLEASIDLDERDDAEGAIGAMAGARRATAFMGGTPEVVPDLGDEAFFGASPFLYFRKGSDVVTIRPPVLEQVAQQKALAKVQGATSLEGMVKAAQEMAAAGQGDPLKAGLEADDAKQGAIAVIKASSKKQGTENEAKGRAMALALARKMLEKI